MAPPRRRRWLPHRKPDQLVPLSDLCWTGVLPAHGPDVLSDAEVHARLGGTIFQCGLCGGCYRLNAATSRLTTYLNSPQYAHVRTDCPGCATARFLFIAFYVEHGLRDGLPINVVRGEVEPHVVVLYDQVTPGAPRLSAEACRTLLQRGLAQNP